MLAQPGLVCCARDHNVEELNGDKGDDVDAEACSSVLGVIDLLFSLRSKSMCSVCLLDTKLHAWQTPPVLA